MSDITASERRLSAALDRLDHLLDHPVQAKPADDADLRRDLDDCRARLDQAEGHAARMAEANEALMAANRDLLDAQATGGIGPDEQHAALTAEIAALRTAREAEMAQMSEIMTELERLLAEDATPAAIDAPVPRHED